MAGQKRAGDFGSESPGPSCKKIPTRQVTKATFDKWQRDNDHDHQMLVWLRCEVAFLFCDVCNRYKDSIISM